ncbi:receptor-like cytosolic serine/threonine-protein kinase RBK1 [Hibiscus syriacus]|uniref:receptor-like cytosolic serine/threonine-protein kinase RBK1 n=1 Tax=Hibiscus syriacus TaxID=106335 RepID=UPI00192334CC|nr:receptor-like cytosolic serine/threonine-protein kinase RBK1 [Hibiscus syriacus]
MVRVLAFLSSYLTDTRREMVEEIEPETESKSEVLTSSESLDGNNDPPSRRESELPVRVTYSDISGLWTSNSAYYPHKLPPVFPKWNRDSYSSQWKSVIENIKKKSAKGFSIIPSLTYNYDISRKKWRKLSRLYCPEAGVVDKPLWKTFSYSDLAVATDNFSPENLLGEGGNAEVYKGHLTDGQVVAVKKLTKNEKEEEDIANDFLLELGIIAHINHPNAARLIGFGVDGGLHLVLQFAPRGSLASVLFAGSDECLDWKTRYKVATGIAEGLKYLHHDCPKRIIHRDITASNILLTEDYEAHISDFGLAKWLPENWHQHVVHPIEGTFGYLAPEYFMHGIVDEKTDVFAFGVLLLEILTGRRAVDSSRQSLVIWGKPLLEKNKVKELVDPRLEDNYDQTEVKRAMFTAFLCINHLAKLRPSMSRVVELLKNEDGPVEWQQKGFGGKAVIVDGCDFLDYNRASYLNDLDRHMQLVLE